MFLSFNALYGIKKKFKNEVAKIDNFYYLLEGLDLEFAAYTS